MGYGYGIWLVFDKEHFETTHIAHVTVACFMQEDDARRLYDELLDKLPLQLTVEINETPEIYPAAYYASDTNKIHSWGYNCKSEDWNTLREICVYHNCDFSPQAHTSIVYDMDPVLFSPKPIEGGTRTVKCDIRLVDIRSDFPVDWRILL